MRAEQERAEYFGLDEPMNKNTLSLKQGRSALEDYTKNNTSMAVLRKNLSESFELMPMSCLVYHMAAYIDRRNGTELEVEQEMLDFKPTLTKVISWLKVADLNARLNNVPRNFKAELFSSRKYGDITAKIASTLLETYNESQNYWTLGINGKPLKYMYSAQMVW